MEYVEAVAAAAEPDLDEALARAIRELIRGAAAEAAAAPAR